MKIMQDSRDALSEKNSFDRNTASQTALSASSFAMRQYRLKNDYLSRIMAHQNTKTFLKPCDISDLDINVPNDGVVLASSKPASINTSKDRILTADLGRVSSPSMKAYRTQVWAPSSAAALK